MADTATQWTEVYTTSNNDMAWPAEGVIRILKGTFPDQRMPRPKTGQSILDVGCGDGRHFPLFQQLELIAAGTEITEEICAALSETLRNSGIAAKLSVGNCCAIPFDNDSFDYLLTWNSCYYMGIGTGNFEDHVSEIARVLNPDGWLICSVPTRDCFIFDDSHVDPNDGNYRIIDSEYFGLRAGERMRCFDDEMFLEGSFDSHFTNFSHATIDIKWFGLRYSWHVFTAQKRQL